MPAENDQIPAPTPFGSTTVDAVILIGLLGLLGYWSLQVLGPFLTVALWSAILAVALYPLLDWLAQQRGSRRLAAALKATPSAKDFGRRNECAIFKNAGYASKP